MSKPQLRVIDNEREHSRDLARRKVQHWREGEVQPTVNQHDNKNAPVLDVDRILNRSIPSHVGRK